MDIVKPVNKLALALLFEISIWAGSVEAAVVNLTQVDFEFDGSPWTLGWKFTVNAPYAVESLGVYDSGQDGLAGSAQVGLWSASGGDLIVQATVPEGTTGQLDGLFRFTPIAPTILNPGTEYIVGSYLSGELATSLFGGNGTVDPLVTVIDVRYSPFGSASFVFPGETDPGTEGAAFLGGNFRGNVAPVPLPAAVWLFGSGVAWLVAIVRRRSVFQR